MSWLTKIFLKSIAIFISAYILPGVEIQDFWSAIVVAFVLALLNTFLKPLLIILTIPFTILTLGLFLFVINALIILTASDLVDGFSVTGFWPALIFSLVMTVILQLFNKTEQAPQKDNDKTHLP